MRRELDAAVAGVDDRLYVLDDELDAFERASAAFCGTGSRVRTGSSTDALALRAGDIGSEEQMCHVAETANAVGG